MGARFGLVGEAPAQIAFLERLRGLAQTRRPMALCFEAGTREPPLLAALGATTAPRVTPAEAAFPAQVGHWLFGRGAEPGLLADPAVPVLVLRDIHEALPSIQRRLAASLRAGSVGATRSRHRARIRARCLFLFETPLADHPLPEALDPELRADLEAWTAAAPPLRDRVNDLSALIEVIAGEAGLAVSARPRLSPAALRRFRRHPWSRNEAELGQVIGRLAAKPDEEFVTNERAESALTRLTPTPVLAETEVELDRRRLIEALLRDDFHKGRAAAALHISRKTLYRQATAAVYLNEVREGEDDTLKSTPLQRVDGVDQYLGLGKDAFTALGLPSRDNPSCP